MLALERRNLILEKLQNEKRVVVSELSQLYGVSGKPFDGIWTSWRRKGLPLKAMAEL